MNFDRKMYAVLAFVIVCVVPVSRAQQPFIQRKGHQFILQGQPYYYIGANYWYGSVLGLQADHAKGYGRLQKELDFLASTGVKNLRVLAAAEGEGMVGGVDRIKPPLQIAKGQFNAEVLDGLDVLLSEMAKRKMKAVLYLSNNWEWSGGFLQYLRWNGLIDDSVFRRKLSWDEMRDYVSRFYSCNACKKDYLEQVDLILSHTNKITGRRYTEEPAIMAWELANEPRPMRPAAIPAYKRWVSDAAAFIKARDRNHLVTVGVEGEIGTENLDIFRDIHAANNIDYLTIHIWPKNWNWFKTETMEADFPQVVNKTVDYINRHVAIAQQLDKPLVLEEFGLPRDHHSYDIASSTSLRDQYYNTIFSIWKQHVTSNGVLAGTSFWAFSGSARPVKGQPFWKPGDVYLGDPPMEEQGLNGVFDSDRSTWDLISTYTKNSYISGR